MNPDVLWPRFLYRVRMPCRRASSRSWSYRNRCVPKGSGSEVERTLSR
jgi:hypothetical protein